MTTNRYELIREKFRPDKVRVLFVGESRPSSGKFFYCGDSNLVNYTAEAFSERFGPFPDMSSFLARFKSLGCFLVDLVPNPVNHLPPRVRRRRRRAGEPALAATLGKTRPLVIIVVMTAIAASVQRAAVVAGAAGTPFYVLPFPAMGHQRRYVNALSALIARMIQERILHDDL